MRSLALSFILASTALLGGCAHTENGWEFGPDYHLFADEEPTVATVKATRRDHQIYRKTSFFLSDFKPDGTLRTFGDYDFDKEDAPCTVLADNYWEPPLFQNQFYDVTVNGETALFHCRATGRTSFASEYRLLKIGTLHECKDRRWDWSLSDVKGMRELGKQCRKLLLQTARGEG